MTLSLMKMDLKKQTKWAVLAILLAMAFTSNLIFSEAATFSDSNVKPGRRLLQTQDTGDDIVRIDPLDHFRRYRGPYDITNKHYWSSTMFSGVYGYAMGVLWLIIGVIYLVYLVAKSCCIGSNKRKLKKRRPSQVKCYLFLRALAVVFAILAITSSGIALAGSAKFQSTTKTILKVITDTADQASSTMYNATGAMRKISIILTQSGNTDGNQAAKYLASSSDKLSYTATGIQRQAQNNTKLAAKVLTIMYILTTTTICLSLGSAVALTGFGVLRFPRVVYTLVILCWLLTSLCWMLFGTYFVVERLSGDTCTALHEFQQNPDNNSLSIILPCNELLSVRTVLTDVSMGLHEVINQVNSEISTLRANSLPDLNYVCNPFSGPPDFRYQPRDCPSDSIPIGDFPKELKMFTCTDTTEVKCKEGFITSSEYNVVEAYTTPVQNLLDTYQEMENLVNCQLVKDAFSEILVHHCKPLKKYIKMLYVSILLLSIAMMILVLTWTSSTRHGRQFLNGSVKPNTIQ